jgi:hypothetical protein
MYIFSRLYNINILENQILIFIKTHNIYTYLAMPFYLSVCKSRIFYVHLYNQVIRMFKPVFL